MNFDKGTTILGDPANPWAYLIRFKKFPAGPMDATNRIPGNTPGIYFWYRDFQYTDDPSKLTDELFLDIRSPKFPQRSGSVNPYYSVSIASSTQVSKGKENEIKEALLDEPFRKQFLSIMNFSMFFQTPLYIGKAQNLRKRTAEHLQDGSLLSQRLNAAGIDIVNTSLLLVPLDSLGIDGSKFDTEELFEEIFSRLFQPHFNLRLG